jgi:alkylation response protein AidB-like acyl-CoA dehydrogenase
MTLSEIVNLLADLNADELDALQVSIQRVRQEKVSGQARLTDVEDRLARLHAGLEAFREGLTEDDLQKLWQAMNITYTYPMKDLAACDWFE